MNYYKLDKETTIKYLKELASLLKKNHSLPCELIIVGGGSILLNYSFRQATVDIDCIDEQGILMNDIVNQIKEKYGLPNDWINTDFTKTESYSDKLIQYSSYYATYSDVLEIRTIKDEYLLAMKIKSARNYKHDLSDISGIATELSRKRNRPVTLNDIKKAVKDLYGNEDAVSKETYEIVDKVLSNAYSYDDIIKAEETNKIKLSKYKIK